MPAQERPSFDQLFPRKATANPRWNSLSAFDRLTAVLFNFQSQVHHWWGERIKKGTTATSATAAEIWEIDAKPISTPAAREWLERRTPLHRPRDEFRLFEAADLIYREYQLPVLAATCDPLKGEVDKLIKKVNVWLHDCLVFVEIEPQDGFARFCRLSERSRELLDRLAEVAAASNAGMYRKPTTDAADKNAVERVGSMETLAKPGSGGDAMRSRIKVGRPTVGADRQKLANYKRWAREWRESGEKKQAWCVGSARPKINQLNAALQHMRRHKKSHHKTPVKP